MRRGLPPAACTVCRPGARNCDGLQPQVCSDNGAGFANQGDVCQTSCVEGRCGVCEPGERRCSGANVEPLRRGWAGLAPAQRLPDPLRQRRLHRVHARRRALLWAHRADLRSRWERLGGQPAVQRLVPQRRLPRSGRLRAGRDPLQRAKP